VKDFLLISATGCYKRLILSLGGPTSRRCSADRIAKCQARRKNKTSTRYPQKNEAFRVVHYSPYITLRKPAAWDDSSFFLPSKEIWRRQTQLFNE
jgi:hypothetical protein